MAILAVSDLHVGDSKSGHQDFYHFLENQSDVEDLIICGDLCDLWVASAGRALKEAQYLIDYIAERFNGRVIYLTGNHDEDFKYLRFINGMIVKQYHVIKSHGKTIVCCHGHQYDSNFYLTHLGPLAKFDCWVVSLMDKWFGIDTRKWLVSLSDRIENDPYDRLIRAFQNNLYHEFSGIHDIVITGHTHRPDILKRDNLVVCNTGDWVQNRSAIKKLNGGIQLLSYETKEVEILKEFDLGERDEDS